VYRLAENDQGPVLELEAESEFLGERPVFNTIARIEGSELPDEYVLLSAHIDSWDGGSGATDNGTGTIAVMEAMRILEATYPKPRRTILAGLWGGEEQGLNGSRAFAADHPEVVDGIQIVLNQDDGTGRTVQIAAEGFTEVGASLARWLAEVPGELRDEVELVVPGRPISGTDHASFVCAGAPGVDLAAGSFDFDPTPRFGWDYFTYTWHTNRDTFDKVVDDDVKMNATLMAMLAYFASEDPEPVSRERGLLPVDPRTGERAGWPECRDGRRSSESR